MNSPQLENGYTRIANELLDALIRYRIPGEERQVLDVIIRKTYGYGKKEDRISLSQFHDMTGIKKPNMEALNRLFAQFLDTVAFERVNTFRKKYTEYGYTLSFEESSRLVLLEKLR